MPHTIPALIRCVREVASVLLHPINGGQTRWKHYPRARMSLLSLLSFVSVFAIMVGGLIAQSAFGPAVNPVTFVTLVLAFAVVFLSASYDARRDRRLGLLPRRRKLF